MRDDVVSYHWFILFSIYYTIPVDDGDGPLKFQVQPSVELTVAV